MLDGHPRQGAQRGAADLHAGIAQRGERLPCAVHAQVDAGAPARPARAAGRLRRHARIGFQQAAHLSRRVRARHAAQLPVAVKDGCDAQGKVSNRVWRISPMHQAECFQLVSMSALELAVLL